MRLGSSLSRDFPCLFTHHNFAIRLRDKINEAFYCNRILRGSPERPSGDLVGTTLKLTTGREVTDGHSHFLIRSAIADDRIVLSLHIKGMYSHVADLCEHWNKVIDICNGRHGPHSPGNAVMRQTCLLDTLVWFSR